MGVYRYIFASSALLCVALSPPVLAQDNGDEELSIIIVTAGKRVEDMQTVPISIAAISGNDLSKSRVTTSDDLVTKVANLQLTSTVGDNTPIFSLRGISMSDYSLNQASPVAVYYDEIYKGNFAFLGVAMYDLERIEVLRGPQGTLYGKNTTGGAINIISRHATLGETSGYLNLGYGNYNRVDVNGALNMPLGDKAAIRLAGTYSRADGWFRNVMPGMPDLDAVREYALRATMTIEPADGVRLGLLASTSLQDPHVYGIYADPAPITRPGLSHWQIDSDAPDRRHARTWSLAMHADIDVADSLTLTSITSWDKGVLNFIEDADGQPIKLDKNGYFDTGTQFSQDLRLVSDSSGPFNIIFGLYFHREHLSIGNTLDLFNDVDMNGDGVVNYLDCIDGGYVVSCKLGNTFEQLKKSYAVYSDMKYSLTDNLSLNFGLRYTHDTGRQYNIRSTVNGADDVPLTNVLVAEDVRYKADNLSGKIGLNYLFANDNLIYGTISTGYRAPSFNAQAFAEDEISVAKAEKVLAFEVGAKTMLFDRRVMFNASAFYYRYTNQQVLSVDATKLVNAQQLLNIPKARIYGAEAEIQARVADGINGHVGLGVLSAKSVRGTVFGIDVAGKRLLNAPTLTVNAGVEVAVMNNSAGRISITPEIAYQSSQYFEPINVSRLRQGGYALLSGHIDYESANKMWNASLWIKNATNRFYYTSRIDVMENLGFDYNHIGAPRTFGVSAGVKF